ncbi:inositol monophosphatase family protein [Candidatus Venteria ishoeyi]|uniref:Nus factor SuhB n=1 Tax=Candidatus Venteria ishoeyi TaxID=1899563 RepID=A0A1H6FCD6_9GAMM|nr:inositol monophosphatase family protein [Candidatus Venteria ishoeyi]MDM8544990.1 inositol monophosphatase family protein [Candidatus Venteria ishoeyi]SEH07752.1 Inositol-1-monophosphatase [Candidatus Venteria ishoeyi]
MSAPKLEHLRPLLKSVAQEELLARFQSCDAQQKADGSLVTEADLAANTRIIQALKQSYPDIPVLSEEMPATEQEALLAAQTPLWCLDPLDGTTNFSAGLPCFAISLALLEAGQAQMGMVYDPMRDECFSAIRGQGAELNGQKLGTLKPRTPLHKGVGLVDFKRLSPTLQQRLLSAPPYASQRNIGAVVLDWCWLAAGRAHVYIHGGQKLWDYAAAALIFAEAGGSACSFEGEEIQPNTLKSRSAIAALDAEIFEQWQNWLNS